MCDIQVLGGVLVLLPTLEGTRQGHVLRFRSVEVVFDLKEKVRAALGFRELISVREGKRIRIGLGVSEERRNLLGKIRH